MRIVSFNEMYTHSLSRSLLYSLILIFAWASLTLTSCVSSSSEDNYTSSDCAITAVTMGTLKRTVHTTTDDGRDTTYSVSVAGSAFPMYVDQLRLEIYNPDSLPQYTDVTKVVLSSVTSDGTVFYRTASGNDTLLTSTDSIDFSQPRMFTCLSGDGTQSKTYKVSVNVHQTYSENFTWTTEAEDPATFAGVSAQKAFIQGNSLMVFALKDGSPTLLTAATDSPAEWTATPITGLTAMTPEDIVLFNASFYCTDGGNLMTSEDGIQWSTVQTPSPLPLYGENQGASFLVSGRETIYALSGNDIYCSTDGSNWTLDTYESGMPAMPEKDRASVWSPMSFNENFSYILIGGTSNDTPCIWRKVVDSNGNDTEPWSLFPQGEDGLNIYPALPQSAMVAYDSKILYAGLEGDTLSNFYLSSDGGRNWLEQTTISNHPANIEAQSFSMVADDDNFVWLICAPSGKVLRGRLNRLGYAENKKIYTKGGLPLIPL